MTILLDTSTIVLPTFNTSPISYSIKFIEDCKVNVPPALTVRTVPKRASFLD